MGLNNLHQRIVLIRHSPALYDDRIITFLKQNGVQPQVVHPYLGEQLGEVDSSVVATVVYGGPFNVFEEEKHPFLYTENKWIEDCLKRDIPLLGICQGAQSIAHVLGAHAGPLPGREYEFGYYEISATEAGREYFPERLVVTQSHFHEFHLPEGAELLASSEQFGQQAMKYGDQCFAFQFHAEATPEMFRGWQQNFTSRYGKPGVQPLEEQNAMMEKYDRAQHDWFMQFQASFFAGPLRQLQEA